MSSLAQAPLITIIVLCVSILMSFSSSFINTRFMPKEHRQQLRNLQQKIAALTKEKNTNMKEGKATGDKKLIKKAQKQEKQLLQLQSQQISLSTKQFKVMPITMGVFFVVWLLLTGSILGMKLFDSPFIGPDPVAYLPWFGGVMPLSLFYWYLICSFTFGSFFQRIFGITGGTD
ncbi:MAG: EMC3/TMCO1 family protein [archaeon]|nr:EMC3/TMCO1 family protein [Candidatus Bathyarchaeum sp.]